VPVGHFCELRKKIVKEICDGGFAKKERQLFLSKVWPRLELIAQMYRLIHGATLAHCPLPILPNLYAFSFSKFWAPVHCSGADLTAAWVWFGGSPGQFSLLFLQVCRGFIFGGRVQKSDLGRVVNLPHLIA
jgi:hypothetical protein